MNEVFYSELLKYRGRRKHQAAKHAARLQSRLLLGEGKHGEQKRQEQLKKDLADQKEELDNGRSSKQSSDYDYLDPNYSRGYGDTTRW